MSATKIRLSPKELELFIKDDWILTKNAILKKIEHFLGDIHVQQKKLIDSFHRQLPDNWVLSSAKISKGEYYKGLPYRILDYPKLFSLKDILAIRTMFWWGHYFSVTLHISGKYKKIYSPKLEQSFALLSSQDFHLCINDNPWEHHFNQENYLVINTLSPTAFKKNIAQKDFCKIACMIPLQQLATTEQFLLAHFETIVKILAD